MAQGSRQATANAPHRSTAGSIKETLESLVIAFILAFAFRAFVLEAFVIPTGSMAVTLYGKQVTTTCSTCGFEYARGIGEDEEVAAARSRMPPIPLRCPNCDTLVDQVEPPHIARPDSGDRILVLKWAYDLGLKKFGPQRWDVTVFKNPSDAQLNYIKRLVGLPGEVLEIIDGDVYTASIADLNRKDPGLVQALDALRQQVARHRNPALRPDTTGLRNPYERGDLRSEYERLNLRLLPHLQIQAKTPQAQESLWVNVYNHDYCPTGTASGKPRSNVHWKPVDEQAAEAWDTSKPEITFSSNSDRPLAIRFAGKPIRDFVAYNYTSNRPDEGGPVGDIRLRFMWLPDEGNGSIHIEANRDLDTFACEIRHDGFVSIEQLRSDLPGGKQLIGQGQLPEPFAHGRAVPIEFVNVDFRVSVKIDGQEVLASTPQQYRPDLRHALQISQDPERRIRPTQVQIAASSQRCRLRHVLLQRDVHYRSVHQNQRTEQATENIYFGWAGWGTAGCPIFLRPEREVDGQRYPGEYFMLGDNSPASKDSRLWWEIGDHLTRLGDEYQIGTVPADQLIGRAFFVYWPAGYRMAWAANIGLIPNVGGMRWIR